MTPDEQWAKSYVYTSKGLRVLLCPQGSLAVFDCAGRMIEMVPGDFDGTMRNPASLLFTLWAKLQEARDTEIKIERLPEPPPSVAVAKAGADELGF